MVRNLDEKFIYKTMLLLEEVDVSGFEPRAFRNSQNRELHFGLIA